MLDTVSRLKWFFKWIINLKLLIAIKILFLLLYSKLDIFFAWHWTMDTIQHLKGFYSANVCSDYQLIYHTKNQKYIILSHKLKMHNRIRLRNFLVVQQLSVHVLYEFEK